MRKSIAGGLLVLLAVSMFLSACGTTTTSGGTSDPNKVSFSELRFGLIPTDNATQEISDTQPLADALSKKLGVKVTLTVGTSYTATIEALASNKLDIALFGPFSYVLAHAKYGVDVLVRQLSADGTPTYNSLIVTTPKTGIKTLAGLKGHTFSFVDPASTSGNLVPRYVLTKAGLNPDTDVKGTFSGNHVASITAIVNHKVDAGAVASDTFAAQKAKGLFTDSDVVILDKSFDIPQGPIGVRKEMSAHDRQLIAAALKSITDPTVLKGSSIGGFVDGKDSDYDPLRDVARTLGIDVATLVK